MSTANKSDPQASTSGPQDSTHLVHVRETPRFVRYTARNNVPYDRSQYARQMDGEIVKVSFQSFMDHYAPFYPAERDVQACVDVLLESTHLVRSEDGRLFFAACDSRPSALFSRETAYDFLSTICQVMGTTQIEGRKPSCKLEQRPHSTTASEITGASHMIDGYFRPLQTTVPDDKKHKYVPTADIIANCEWKLDDNNDCGVDNRRKVVSGAGHNMNNDPRRQFTYSITIEDDSMALWYWSRSHSAKSEPFTFTTDIYATVRAFASFIFATMEELGYDASIQRVQDTSRQPAQLAYVFRVQGRYFKTLRSISEHLGVCITGRATRVFEVIEVRSFDDLAVIGKTPKVLKDVWLDESARTEREIQNAIFEELDELAGRLLLEGAAELPHFSGIEPEEKALLLDALRDKNYRRHFLTIECDEQGSLSKPPPVDAVPARGLFTVVPPLMKLAQLSNGDKTRASQTSEAVSASEKKKSPPPPREYAPKRQYRVVFQEVCYALHKVDDLRAVLMAMKDCLLAVQLMFLIGWVHRDISSGNLLWYPAPEGGRGILSDLEYAKKCDPDGMGSRDPKTGTPYFMAVEIQTQRPIVPQLPPKRVKSRDVFSSTTSIVSQIRHNFQHDLESFFWLLLWTITARIDNADLQAITDPMFQHESVCSSERHSVISQGLPEEQLAKALPTPIKGFAHYMNGFAHNLLFAYGSRKSQADYRDVTTYSWLYSAAHDMLDTCLEDAVHVGPDALQLITYSARQDVKTKRSRPLQPGNCKRMRSPNPDVGNASFKSQKSSKNELRSKPREPGL